MPDHPAALMRRAAARLREAARAVESPAWGGRPWAAEECSDKERGMCRCIVYQGEYKPFDEPQVPPIHYVADAETPELAAWIALMHPGTGLALAGWLEAEAPRCAENVSEDRPECTHDDCCSCEKPLLFGCDFCGGWLTANGCDCWDGALAVARAILGEGDVDGQGPR